MSQALQISNASLSESAARGVGSFATGAWDYQGAENDFLAVLALRIVLSGYLIGDVQRVAANDATQIIVRLDTKTNDRDRIRAANLLFEPLKVYADLSGIRVEKIAGNDVGAIQGGLFAGVVIVTVIAGATAVMLYVADKSATIVENALRRRSASKEIQEADAKHLEAMNLHVQREQAAGRVLPFNEAEKGFMSSLEARKSALLKSAFEPPQIGFPIWVVPVGLGAAAVVTAFVLSRRKRR